MLNTQKFSVNSVSESPAKTKIKTRGFEFLVDEPEELGGSNEAPNPVEYVLAGYAGCINVVAHIVAKELNINLKNLEIFIEGDINPSRLFGHSFNDRAGYQSLKVRLKTSAKINKGLEVKWLKEIEERCPVNDNLSNKTPIQLTLN
ncbi:MAG: OsmC family protein [Fulvivirga sp.]|nr:OsmC family protein [Fulvivirga sp.]